MPFDPDRPYRVDPKVALRPEPFGALAYHYGNRRLLFLRSTALVSVLERLDDHVSAAEAVASVTTAARSTSALLAALGHLESSGVIGAR
ncbi:MAG: mycofactocin biosynthesis chaperone MftB [Acidimicrobiia bacterium]|nr:mycofactocin biosynthesis chaperone MftB [Acidimicrobiia bacterium]